MRVVTLATSYHRAPARNAGQHWHDALIKHCGALALAGILGLATPAIAQVDNEKTVPGAVCSGSLNAADWDTVFQCSGGVWQRSAYFFGNSLSLCNASHAGLTRYAGVLKLCDGSVWTPLGGAPDGQLGSFNTAQGTLALNGISTGSYNVGLGYQAAQYQNIASNNVFVVADASASGVITGNDNTAIGTHSLVTLSAGTNNTGVGLYTLNVLTTGSDNTALGTISQQGTTSGSGNTSIGHGSLNGVGSGSSNTAIGLNAAGSLLGSTATANTGIGWNAMASATTGGNNTALGTRSCQFERLPGCTGFGSYSNGGGSGGTGSGINNTFFGNWAGYSLTSGSSNTAVGSVYPGTSGPLLNLTTGSANTAFGPALKSLSTGSNNTGFGVGLSADNLSGMTTASNSTAFGGSTLANGNSPLNAGIGYEAMYSASGATGKNVGGGYYAYHNLTTGTGNTGFGYGSGAAITTGSNNIVLGQNATFAANKTKWLSIGNFIEADMTNSLMGLGVTSFKTSLTLDVSIGYSKLKLNTAAPATCDAAHNGAIALTRTGYPACICSTANTWITFNAGTACSW